MSMRRGSGRENGGKYRFWNQTWRGWEGGGDELVGKGEDGGGRRAYLDAAGGHAELCGELVAAGRVRLRVEGEDGLEGLELDGGGASAVLDLVGGVGVEGGGVGGEHVVVEDGVERVEGGVEHTGCMEETTGRLFAFVAGDINRLDFRCQPSGLRLR